MNKIPLIIIVLIALSVICESRRFRINNALDLGLGENACAVSCEITPPPKTGVKLNKFRTYVARKSPCSITLEKKPFEEDCKKQFKLDGQPPSACVCDAGSAIVNTRNLGKAAAGAVKGLSSVANFWSGTKPGVGTDIAVAIVSGGADTSPRAFKTDAATIEPCKMACEAKIPADGKGPTVLAMEFLIATDKIAAPNCVQWEKAVVVEAIERCKKLTGIKDADACSCGSGVSSGSPSPPPPDVSPKSGILV